MIAVLLPMVIGLGFWACSPWISRALLRRQGWPAAGPSVLVARAYPRVFGGLFLLQPILRAVLGAFVGGLIFVLGAALTLCSLVAAQCGVDRLWLRGRPR